MRLGFVRLWALIKILECQNEDFDFMVRWYALVECVVKKWGVGTVELGCQAI